MFRKIFVAISILFIGCLSAFAIEEDDVAVDLYETNVSRSEFQANFGETASREIADALDEEIFNDEGYSIDALELLGQDDASDDFADMYDIMMDQIPSNVKANTVYYAVGISEVDEESIYGYIIFAHFLSKSDVEVWPYYFIAEAD